MVEGIFADREDGVAYAPDDLVERSGIDPDLFAAIRAAGLLRDPIEYGRDAYDGEDLDLVRTMTELHGMGIPTSALVEMGRLYAEGVEAMQRAVVDLFTSGG